LNRHGCFEVFLASGGVPFGQIEFAVDKAEGTVRGRRRHFSMKMLVKTLLKVFGKTDIELIILEAQKNVNAVGQRLHRLKLQ